MDLLKYCFRVKIKQELSLFLSFIFRNMLAAASGASFMRKRLSKDDTTALADMTQQLKMILDRLRKLVNQRSTIIDPWAVDVPQAYETLISKLPRGFVQNDGHRDPLDVTNDHWSALLQFLPWMDPESQAHVLAVAQYAMRQVVESKQQSASRMRSSLSCLNLHDHVSNTTHKRADGWLPPSFETYTMPKSQYADQFLPPAPSASVSTPIVQEKPTFRRWFKGNKVVPLQPSSSSSSSTIGKSKMKFWVK